MTREEAIERFENIKANALVQKACGVSAYWQNEIDGTVEALDMAIEALSDHSGEVTEMVKKDLTSAVQTDLVQRSDVLEVISDAQDGSGSTYNILQPIWVKVNNLPSCHRCDECDEQFYQQLLEKEMIELPQEYVSVVRCKDCRWWQDDYMGTWCSRLSGLSGTVADFFCAYGERREPKNE